MAVELEGLVRQLGAQGFKMTQQRQEILRLLTQKKGHWSAQEIHQAIGERFSGLSLDTVYRNLKYLCKMGILKELDFQDGRSRYEIRGSHHHHHLLCLGCGEAIELTLCPLHALEEAAQKEEFRITGHSLKVFGYCRACSP